MATTSTQLFYGTFSTFVSTNLVSLANDATDPYLGWQSGIVDNTTLRALDYEVVVKLAMTSTVPANDQTAYVYALGWVYDGAAWQAGGNYGTTTYPVSTQSTALISDPNSCKLAASIPYKVSSLFLEAYFTVAPLFGGVVPDAWSLAFRDNTGAAVSSTNLLVAYRPIGFTQT